MSKETSKIGRRHTVMEKTEAGKREGREACVCSSVRGACRQDRFFKQPHETHRTNLCPGTYVQSCRFNRGEVGYSVSSQVTLTGVPSCDYTSVSTPSFYQVTFVSAAVENTRGLGLAM